MQRDPLLADLTDQVHRPTRRFIEGQPQLVLGELLFQTRAQLALRVKETVRGHEPVDALVRPKVVVVADPVAEPPSRIVEIFRRSTIPKLIADGLPQTLALAQRLRMMRSTHHVLDALLRKKLLKAALPAPSEVLATLISQHFTRFAETRNALQKRLGDERSPLMCRQRPGHDVATVVVEEDRQVDAATLTTQDKTRDVRLPHLARPSTFEATREF